MAAGPTDWKSGGFKPSSQEALWIYISWLHFLPWCRCLPDITITTPPRLVFLIWFVLKEQLTQLGMTFWKWLSYPSLSPLLQILKVFYFYRNNLNLIANSSSSFPWITPSYIKTIGKMLLYFPAQAQLLLLFLSCFVLGFLSFSFKGTRLSLYRGGLLPTWFF